MHVNPRQATSTQIGSDRRRTFRTSPSNTASERHVELSASDLFPRGCGGHCRVVAAQSSESGTAFAGIGDEVWTPGGEWRERASSWAKVRDILRECFID